MAGQVSPAIYFAMNFTNLAKFKPLLCSRHHGEFHLDEI